MTIYCGVDFHVRQQLIAWCDTRDGEIKFEKLVHQLLDQVQEFYARLPRSVVIGLEACDYCAWFEDLLAELGHEVRIGQATEIRCRARSRQKTDRRDAELLLDLLLKGEFPRVHRPSAPESRNLAAITLPPPAGPQAH